MFDLTITGATPTPTTITVVSVEALRMIVDGVLARAGEETRAYMLFPDEGFTLDDPITFAKCENLTFSWAPHQTPMETTMVEEGIDPIYHYVLMRADVPDFLSGKAQAQANHAGTRMVIKGLRSGNQEIIDLIDEWEAEGDGFGTCIVLAATAPEMRQAVSFAGLLGIHSGIVHDPSYPLRDGEKIQTIPLDTCGYLIGRKSVCAPVVGRFPLFKMASEK